MTMKIKTGDTVVVRKGSDKGATGKVVRFNDDRSKVLIEGVNIRTIHKKANQTGQTAGVFKEPRMISVSNIGLKHPTKKAATSRVGFELTKAGKRRVFKANGKEVK